MRALAIVQTALLLVSSTVAHSWVELLAKVNDAGNYTGDLGYPRGFVDRSDPDFNGFSDNWILPPEPGATSLRVQSNDLLCHPNQRNQTQSANYSRLQVSAGDWFAMRYAENGHVTLPTAAPGKPAKGGTIFVFGTTQPKTDEKLLDVLQWTKNGTGGDQRGILITAQNFNDGRCYQINPSSGPWQERFAANYSAPPADTEKMCDTYVQVPENVTAGKPYTIYWVWQWPTQVGTVNVEQGKDQYYTTCSDVDVVIPNAQAVALANEAVAAGNGTTPLPWDLMKVAIPSYKAMSQYALTTDPMALYRSLSSSTVAVGVPSSTTALAPPAYYSSSGLPVASSAVQATSAVISPPAQISSSPANAMTSTTGSASNLPVPTLYSRPGESGLISSPAASAPSGVCDGSAQQTITVTTVVTVTASVSIPSTSKVVPVTSSAAHVATPASSTSLMPAAAAIASSSSSPCAKRHLANNGSAKFRGRLH